MSRYRRPVPAPATPPPSPRENRGAQIDKGPGPLTLLHNYLLRHMQTLFYALGQLSRRPFASLMTAAVIGIALAMPAGLQVLLKNAQQVTSGWDGATQISLFLHRQINETQAQRLVQALRADAQVDAVYYISPQHALEEFRHYSGFGDALDALGENPLPPVIVVQPQLSVEGPAAVEALVQRLRERPEVDLARLDMQWVKRLYALMEIVRRGVWVLSSLLALAVLLVVGNTIRLAIQNRRDEIVITKLIGASDAFIRRPFLYCGFWYGLVGGIVAFVMVTASMWLLQGPVHALAGLYHSEFRLENLDAGTTGLLLLAGTLLGLGGSWIAVGRHLRDIEPT